MSIAILIVMIVIFAFILGFYKHFDILYYQNKLGDMMTKLKNAEPNIPTYISEEYTKRVSGLQAELSEHRYRSFSTTNKEDRKAKYTTTTKQLAIAIEQLEREIDNVL